MKRKFGEQSPELTAELALQDEISRIFKEPEIEEGYEDERARAEALRSVTLSNIANMYFGGGGLVKLVRFEDEEYWRALTDEEADVAVMRAIKASGLPFDAAAVKAAIAKHGRGHFLAPYDGHEIERYGNGRKFFIYRVA